VCKKKRNGAGIFEGSFKGSSQRNRFTRGTPAVACIREKKKALCPVRRGDGELARGRGLNSRGRKLKF